MIPSTKAFDLLKSIETLQLKPMLPTPKDRPTIGYGCTTWEDNSPIKLTDKPITKDRADSLLNHKAQEYINCVNKIITKPMTQQQFDAFFIMCFNCGVGRIAIDGFSKPAKVAQYFNNNELDLLEEWWTKSFITQKGVVLQGLIDRRNAEWQIFDKGIYLKW